MTSFADAMAVKALDSHTYSAHFSEQWCIGTVPHGGFVTSVFLNVARTHFHTTLSAQNQPHTITLHLEFLRRTSAGPAHFTVHDAKLGRQTSTLHITLTQHARTEVVGYITNTNLDTESGLSLRTNWSLHPPPYTVDLARLKNDADPHWARQTKMPFAPFRKASQNVHFYFPRRGQLARAIADEWLCFASGERFTNESLGYVSDMWPQVVEAYRAERDPYLVDKAQGGGDADVGVKSEGESAKGSAPARFWYPTLLLNLEVKKLLPAEGVEWLFARVRAKLIRNGRMDLECVILDAEGDVVALSHHVTMILGVERNMAERRVEGASKM